MHHWITDVLTSAFHDERALDLPHKLYQRSFAPEFVDALAPALRPAVDWVEPFVREFVDVVGDSSSQFWVYGARRGKLTSARGRGDGVAGRL